MNHFGRSTGAGGLERRLADLAAGLAILALDFGGESRNTAWLGSLGPFYNETLIASLRLLADVPLATPRRDDAGEKSVYAIISDGAHQYRVEEGQVLELQRKDLPEDTKTYEFDRVLMIGDLENGAKIGQPVVEGAKVTAAVLGEIKGEKLVIQKHRRRKNSSRKKGHRQKFLQVRIEQIEY